MVNPATNPALTRSVDDPGRIGYQSQQFLSAGADVIAFPQVPAGHRLVIQHVSAEVSFQSLVNYQVQVLVAGGQVNQVNQSFLAPFSLSAPYFDQLVQLYVDAGERPNVEFVADSGATHVFNGLVTLTGYLLDCTVAPCAPIAH